MALLKSHTHQAACWRSYWSSSERPRRDASAHRRWPPCFRTRRENEWTFRGRGEWAGFAVRPRAEPLETTLLPLQSPTLLKRTASRTQLLYRATGAAECSRSSAATLERRLRIVMIKTTSILNTISGTAKKKNIYLALIKRFNKEYQIFLTFKNERINIRISRSETCKAEKGQ